jgi:hypothetical protein
MIPLLWRFLRENLWPFITLMTFGLTLWATLSLTTLTQEKENQRVLMAKSFPEELRLAKTEGIFPPKPQQKIKKQFIPSGKDAASAYAEIDVKKIQNKWGMKDYSAMSRYMETWMPTKKRNPKFDAEIDAFLEKNAGIMAIAERASMLPLSSIDTEKDKDMSRRELAIKDLFFMRIYRRGESNITKSIEDLGTVIRIKKQFNHDQPDHYFEIVILRLFRSIYKYCITKKKSQEKNDLWKIINDYTITSFNDVIYHSWRISSTYEDIKKYNKPKEEKPRKEPEPENPLLMQVPKSDPFLDINAYVRFLDSTNRVLQSKIYGEGFWSNGPYDLAKNIHEIRTVQKKRQGHPKGHSPREEWKFYQAIEEELKKKYMGGYWGGYSSAASSYLLRLLRWRQTMTMIALYEYREKHGTFPQSLADLPPNSSTIDPIMEKPFIWKNDAKRGWLLYSPGLDEKDNGGAERDVPAGVRDIVVELGK